jgi:signal transduction histidine kinase/CheY-like chemotaxis protein
MDVALDRRAWNVKVERPTPHPRTIGWVGTAAMAMGGSNQSLFLMAALFVGQGDILGQGSAAVPLLIFGLLLGWAAAPGWTELILMYPNRVGGIAATCAEAFRPYSPVLANLAGVCYWWGWVPTCGLTAILSASAIHQWYLPGLPVAPLAAAIVACFAIVNLLGIARVTRVAVAIATVSATLAFLSGLVPIVTGHVDWRQATTFHLTLPFEGWFGALTSLMAGLYLIGFAAPAFEAAACHVGETIDPVRNVPRAMLAAALMAAVYFVLLPVVWLGVLGPQALGRDLALELGPTFAPVFGSVAKAAAIWFMMFNMFHGTLQPLAGAARTLSQLAEDGLLPRFFGWRLRSDAPWVATSITAIMAILFLAIGDPVWLIAAANFTYLIGICLPNVAVWLLRCDEPEMARPYRAPRGTIVLGVVAALIWGISAILGFQQFGLPTVLVGLAFAYAGAALYAWRKLSDRRSQGLPPIISSLHIKLTGAMLLVLTLDGAGYLLAVTHVPAADTALVAALEDIFVAVAMLTITVGLVLPGMIAHSAEEVSKAADRLATGTLADFSRAMQALGRGDIEAAQARIDIVPVIANSRDEVGRMAASFNALQGEVARAATGLQGARDGLRTARENLTEINESLRRSVAEYAVLVGELSRAKLAAEAADRAKGDFLANISHEIRTPLNGVIGALSVLGDTSLEGEQKQFVGIAQRSAELLLAVINDVLDLSRIEAGQVELQIREFDPRRTVEQAVELLQPPAVAKRIRLSTRFDAALPHLARSDGDRVRQVLVNLVSNAVKFTSHGTVTVGVGITAGSQPGSPGTLLFEVEDSGIGIADDRLHLLFQRFSQVDSSLTRPYGGTGLGLAISKSLVDLLGGEIGVESKLGRGSRFWFTVPLAVDHGQAAASEVGHAAAEPARLVGRILLAEDSQTNAALAMRLLQRKGAEVVLVSDGRQALEAIQHTPCDLVLMDVSMPNMDGIEATRRIRTLGGSFATIPIIGLTAHALAGDRAACEAAGMNDYVAKPFNRIAFLRTVADWLPGGRNLRAA